MNIPQDIKKPFSKRARAALNACARFCNNLCMGFGIYFKQVNGGISIGIDQPKLVEWLKEQKFARSGASAATEDAYSTQAADKATVASSQLSKDHWDAGQFTDVNEDVVMDTSVTPSVPKKTGFTFYAVSRSQKVIDVDYLFFRKVTVNEHGVIAAMSAEEFAVAVADESAL